ncbi:MAG: phytanoyl-CoA dioxygenase family protein [candidate division Zixibacteria bacterium]|nr:phytanoyl-CoA dioxygenase family protein [candidate division Zixibacteria bacterium]
MLSIEIVPCAEIDRAVAIFHRDGFVAVGGTLTPEQLAFAQAGAKRVIAEQTTATPLDKANRGFARYSFGFQTHHPEWAQLVDLPGVLPIAEKIFGSPDYTCCGAGGDYSLPGAKIQHLHADMIDFLRDPEGRTTFQDLPTPFLVVNFLMVDFTALNGAIRFVPCTHRSRQPVPSLQDEPEWMRRAIVCAPAGTALYRDVRCWHGGTANDSTETRPMTSVGYYAPWFYRGEERHLPHAIYRTLSPRGQHLCRHVVVETDA